jgi:flagellar basal-body rod protein FlgG
MIRAFYSGKEGLVAQQTAMDDISNNIANISTTGYKSKSTQFSDVLYSSMLRPDQPNYASTLTGNGVALAAVENDMSDGMPEATDNMLDCCVNAGGFFAVQDTGGNTFYTRDGSFSVMHDQGGDFLKNAQGLYVLDASGNRINVDNSGTPVANPGVFDFSNSQGLLNVGGNLFTGSASSGAPTVSNEGFKRGYLESSNVDLAQQMAQLIITQRGFQMSSRVVQTADQIESMTNDLKS